MVGRGREGEAKGEGVEREGKGGETRGREGVHNLRKNDPPPVIRWLVTGQSNYCNLMYK